jgi:hypothetical protein
MEGGVRYHYQCKQMRISRVPPGLCHVCLRDANNQWTDARVSDCMRALKEAFTLARLSKRSSTLSANWRGRASTFEGIAQNFECLDDLDMFSEIEMNLRST